MPKYRIDASRFRPVIDRVIKSFDDEHQTNYRANILQDRSRMAEWFQRHTGIVRGERYYSEAIISKVDKTPNGESVELHISEEVFRALIRLGDGDDDIQQYLSEESEETGVIQAPAAREKKFSIVYWFAIGTLIFLGTWIALMLLPTSWAKPEGPAGKIEPFTHFIQAVISLVFVIWLGNMERKRLGNIEKAGNERMVKSFRQLFIGLKVIWISYLLLYLFLGVTSILSVMEEDYVEYLKPFADYFNAIGSIGFFYLFLIMDQVSFPIGSNGEGIERFRRFLSWGIVIGGILVALATLDRALPLGDYEGILLIFYSLGLAIPYIYCFGRLDSHYFAVNRLALAPLYLYGLMQPIWPVLLDAVNHKVDNVIFMTALALKVYFFLFIAYYLDKGRFKVYFEGMHREYREKRN